MRDLPHETHEAPLPEGDDKGPAFPAERAFVLQFRQRGHGGCAGRVEHVLTGRSAGFDDLGELGRLLEGALRSLASSSDAQPADPFPTFPEKGSTS